MSAGGDTYVRYLVLIWLCLAATIAYVQRNCINVAEKAISADLKLSDKQMGLVMAAFFVTYAVFQMPTGWLAHLWGSRRGLTLLCHLWSMVSALTAAALGFWSILLARLALGGIQSGIFPCATSTISKWYPPQGRAFPSGALAAFMSVGAAAGSLLTGYLVEPLGWRLMFILYALPGLLWAMLFWRWFRDRPEDHASVGPGELAIIRGDAAVRPSAAAADQASEPIPWGTILLSGAMWWIGAQQLFRAAGYMFFTSWFPKYLRETRNVTLSESGVLTAMPLLAVVAGSLAGGFLSDAIYRRTGSLRLARQGLAALSMGVCAGLVFLAAGIRNQYLAVSVISAGSFCAALAGPCAYTITIDLGGRHVTSVFSFMNMCGNIGAVAFPIVLPYLVAWTESWHVALTLFGSLYVAAGLCWVCFDGNKRIVT
jgi:ACS family glucarate transporter-like MFS transporter